MSRKPPLPPQEVREIVKTHMIANAVAAPAGAFIPCLDQGVVSASWIKMFCDIASYYDHRFNSAAVTKIVAAAGSGLGAYMVGSKLMTWLCAFVFTGPLGPASVNAALNAYFTRTLGYAMNAALKDEDLNASTLKQIGKSIASYIIPIPSISDIKEV